MQAPVSGNERSQMDFSSTDDDSSTDEDMVSASEPLCQDRKKTNTRMTKRVRADWSGDDADSDSDGDEKAGVFTGQAAFAPTRAKRARIAVEDRTKRVTWHPYNWRPSPEDHVIVEHQDKLIDADTEVS